MEELARRPRLQHATILDEDQLVGEQSCLFRFMGDQHGGAGVMVLERAQLLDESAA